MNTHQIVQPAHIQ